MKRILLIGNSPLPWENTKSRPAAGLRTYQFLKPLLRDGGTVSQSAERAFSSTKREIYEVTLVCVAMPECYDKDPGYREIRHSGGYTEVVIPKNDPSLLKRLQALHDEIHPDAIVGVNTFPSYIASRIRSRAPLWADLNGWIMAEGQAQAYKKNTNDYLGHYFGMENSILRRGDKFSAVSTPESYALLGELAGIGRLNKESFGYKFVHLIPNGTEWFEGEGARGEVARGEVARGEVARGEVARGDGARGDVARGEVARGNVAGLFDNIPAEAFVALWLGGYNTWVDEVTLFKGVTEAMSKCDDLYFVSTGGDIAGLDNKTFAKFKSMIDKSEYKDRFVFLGWVDTDSIPSIYERADVGLNVDRKCAETMTGARNRINEMMKFGLPVVTTLGSEISYEVVRVGAGRGARSGKHAEVADAICSIYKDRGEYGKKGALYIKEECNYDKVMKPLLKWLENPRPAPDRGVRLKFGRRAGLKASLRYLKENGVRKALKKFRG